MLDIVKNIFLSVGNFKPMLKVEILATYKYKIKIKIIDEVRNGEELYVEKEKLIYQKG